MQWCAVIVICVFVVFGQCTLPKDQEHWKRLAEEELASALKQQWNLNTAKNMILFIGDGMGPNTVSATRIYKGGEGHTLSYEKFPHVGLLKTYSADQMVPDSASTATALLCGSKTNSKVLGLDASVQASDCAASLKPEAKLRSLAADALTAGKSAGLVTTMRVTHATPAAVYANCADRNWECEATLPAGSEHCKDVARQLIEDWPGKELQVILGGGMQMLVSNSEATATDPLDTWSCRSQDGRNLINSYIEDKKSRGLKYSFVKNNQELRSLSNDTEYLLGIFSNTHLKYEFERDDGPEGMPSIVDMTEAAIKVLQKNNKGYFLMVEGGNIDMAHHRGRAKTAINESSAFDDAVQRALTLTDERDTLVIVTADHTHTMSINGYQDRGSNLFGIAQASRHDGTNYTTLSYSTGGPGAMHYYVESGPNGQEVRRKDPSWENTEDFHYEQNAGIITDENTHGGGDVAIYAIGPHSHLFHSVHEQHYVYHAVSYAAGLGQYAKSNVLNRAPSLAFTGICLLVYRFIK